MNPLKIIYLNTDGIAIAGASRDVAPFNLALLSFI